MPDNTKFIARNFVTQALRDNAVHIERINAADDTLKVPAPIATVVMCSDSRVQKAAFSGKISNDFFMVRNIGNQIVTAEGSIDYGVLCLNTPLLLIIGHSQCNAISVAMSGNTPRTKCVENELRTLNLGSAVSVNDGVLCNVHYQVETALNKFRDLVSEDRLTILGAVYDFRNDFQYDCGRFIFVNVNGARDPRDMANILEIGDCSVFFNINETRGCS